jgi:hypothetical protein
VSITLAPPPHRPNEPAGVSRLADTLDLACGPRLRECVVQHFRNRAVASTEECVPRDYEDEGCVVSVAVATL